MTQTANVPGIIPGKRYFFRDWKYIYNVPKSYAHLISMQKICVFNYKQNDLSHFTECIGLARTQTR